MKISTHFKAPGAPASKGFASAPRAKVHPAAAGGATRVRLPDTGPIGADNAPFAPGVGKF